MMQEMRNIINYIELKNKTPEQLLQEQQEIDLAKEQLLNNKLLNNITIIDNFTPNIEDKNKYIETSFSTIENQVKITSTQSIPNIIETIVDLKKQKELPISSRQNKNIEYKYRKRRTKTRYRTTK